MKLGLIAQIRDEIDIIEAWLQHVDALFDYVFLIDHQSIDGTEDFLKQAVAQRSDWDYFFLETKTKLQAGAATLIMHEAFLKELDYLFFLDGDEFIQVSSRAELEAMLNNWSNHTILPNLHWKNCICRNFEDKIFSFEDELWIPEQLSDHKKIVVSNLIYSKYGRDLKINYGNHATFTDIGGLQNSKSIGTLLHVPVRSRDQVIRKVILNIIAKRGLLNTDRKRSSQTYEILNRIADGNFSDDEVRAFTLAYDKIDQGNTSVSELDLQTMGYSSISFSDLKIAKNDTLILTPVKSDLPFPRQIANALNNLEINVPEYVKLKIQDNIISIDETELIQTQRNKIKISVAKIVRKARKILS